MIAHVITCSQYKRLVYPGNRVIDPGDRAGFGRNALGGTLEHDRLHALFKGLCPVDDFTSGVHHERASVKDELVLTTNMIDIHDRYACFGHARTYLVFAIRLAAHLER